ncbi:MAG TPA: SUMF1/EgtB/PvdO family nonheme iron enzyme [Polyangiaceae bacterium]|nr:SUMF1/EgtB/PvdO family nonheme iron enzyme [Polyangiaceae bacterium]
MLTLTRARLGVVWLLAWSSAACAARSLEPAPKPAGQRAEPAKASDPAAPSTTTASATENDARAPAYAESSAEEAPADAGTSPERSESATGQACPSGMLHVKFDYCPDVTRRCLDKEYDKPNHITICHRYAPEKPECHAPRVPLDFCIDEYEYPNQLAAKPPVMLNFFEASALCTAQQKRLCYEREWVTACEGPEEKPFPYGYERSSKQCNFDNRWVNPHLALVYAKDPELQRAELTRLDRSVPSGQMPGCVSDFGVHDLTGNVDEWAIADHVRPHEHAKFSALKGGAWGHVRNACRPVTTSHAPEFRYYFIGFRCCSEARK